MKKILAMVCLACITRLTKRLVVFEFSAKRFGAQILGQQILRAIIGASLILSCASVCRGAVTYYWDGSNTATPTSGSDANITVGSITRVNGGASTISDATSPSTGLGTYTGASGGYNFEASTVAGSLSTSSSTYFSVTLTPSSGFAITLNSISLGSRSTPTGPTTLTAYSSIDSYATAIGSVAVLTNSSWGGALRNITFSGSSLTGSDGSGVTFRIYGSDGTGGTLNWRIDDISLQVTLSAVPEPAEWGLISALGLLGICGVRTWREQRAAKHATLA